MRQTVCLVVNPIKINNFCCHLLQDGGPGSRLKFLNVYKYHVADLNGIRAHRGSTSAFICSDFRFIMEAVFHQVLKRNFICFLC